MIRLTKNYRVTWDKESLIIQCDSKQNYNGSETFVPDRFGSFESDSFEEVQAKVIELNLIEPEERILDELI